MCTYRQHGIWWYEFFFEGKRIRKSSKSTDREVARTIEQEHLHSLEDGTGGVSATYETLYPTPVKRAIPTPSNSAPAPITRAMTLREAGDLWLSQKAWKRLKPKTLECSQVYLKSLISFFGNIRLSEIHAGSVRTYQAERAKKVGPSAVNHEVNALAQILRQAKCWGGITDYYSPIKEPEWQKPKTFTFEEQQAIFAVASEDPGFELAEIVFAISRNTSACGSELRLAHIRNLNLNASPPTFEVTGDTTKNDVRPRILPLNAEAERSFRKALERANRLGSHLPSHFLFPFRKDRSHYDPERPASKGWLRKQTQGLRDRTGIKHLRPHAWRHQLCTEMLEQGVPAETVKGVMGWVSERMIDTYSHTRLSAKQKALGVLEKVAGGGGPKAQWLPALPAPPEPDLRAEVARLTQMIEQLQAQAARPKRAAKQRQKYKGSTQNGVMYRQLATSPRGGLVQFPQRKGSNQ